MPVAKNTDDLEEIRADDLAKKVKLEVPFQRNMNTFLRKVNSDFANQYVGEGTVLNINDYKPELSALLIQNYNRISRQFKFNVRESFDERGSQEINASIDANIARFTRQVTDQKSNIILNTTDKEIQAQLTASVTELVEEDREVNNVVVGTNTRKKLNEHTLGRSNIIAITETQMMAESTKFIEDRNLINNDVVLGGVVLAAVLKKIWVTTLDERTRLSHIAANGQRRNPLEAFIVQGESLMYPGDPNGSPSNIINCRCASVRGIF